MVVSGSGLELLGVMEFRPPGFRVWGFRVLIEWKEPPNFLCPQERVFDSDGNFLREEWEDYDGDSTTVFRVLAGSR